MKTAMMLAAALCACAAAAQEAVPELTERDDGAANWRVTVGGMGRGNVRTKLKGATADHETLWGADLDVQYNVWQNQDFAVWAGIGGTFCPEQDAWGRRGRSARGEHQVSDDGFVTYDFDYTSRDRRSVDLGYGELRLMAVPEWKATDRFSLGARLGVAFDWMRAKCRREADWAWRSQFRTSIPGVMETTDVDSDSGRTGESDAVTKFAAQAVVGVQATYLLTERLGVYAACDWRIGDDTTFRAAGDRYSVDLSGWYAGAGVVVQF